MKTAIIPAAIALVSLPSLAFARDNDAPAPVAATTSPSSDPRVDDANRSAHERGAVLTHEGFMLRMTAGAALLGAGVEPDQSIEFGAGGVGESFSLQLGGYIVPNLALHADLLGASSEHTVVAYENDDEDVSTDQRLSLGTVGLGVTYFIMPYNLSLTGSLMFGEMHINPERSPSYRTDYAVLGKFGVAKEWAVSDYWGLGVGGSALFGYGRGENADGEDFDAGIGGFTIDFVASYD